MSAVKGWGWTTAACHQCQPWQTSLAAVKLAGSNLQLFCTLLAGPRGAECAACLWLDHT